jgi:hypothetical protein
MLLMPEVPLAQRSSLLVWILRLCRTIRSLTAPGNQSVEI